MSIILINHTAPNIRSIEVQPSHMKDTQIDLVKSTLQSLQVSKTSLTGDYYDRGVDLNGDATYDYLIIDVTLNVTDPGTYQIQLENLLDPTSQVIHLSNETVSMLSSGLQNVSIWLRAAIIFNSGLDGPYTLGYVELLDTQTYTQLDYANQPYTTNNAYLYAEFDTPSARLVGSYYDMGLDNNDDGIYDYLLIMVTLNVTESGYYDVVIDLHARDGTHLVQNDTFADLSIGLQNVSIYLQGAAIYELGKNGPYIIDDVAVYDELDYYHDYYDYEFLDRQTQAYVTENYDFTDFNSEPSGLNPNIFTKRRWIPFITNQNLIILVVLVVGLGVILFITTARYKRFSSTTPKTIHNDSSKTQTELSVLSRQSRSDSDPTNILEQTGNDISSLRETSPFLLQEKFKKLNGTMIVILFVLLDHHPAPLTHSELANLSEVGKSTLTYSLTRLEQLGFIHRRPKKEDFRFIEVGLKPQRIELVKELRQRIGEQFPP